MELVLRKVADLSPQVAGRQVVAAGVGDRDRLVLLLGTSVPGSRGVTCTAAVFADRRSGSVEELAIEPVTVVDPLVQPLANGGLLIADSLGSTHGPPNAHVIGPDGRVQRSMVLGDAIEHMLVDKLDRVWVGYFDEGVFGNSIASSGLVRFDLTTGEPDWSFHPPEGSDFIADCYALNIDGDTAWMVYYTDFDLFRIDSDGQTHRWRADAGPVGLIGCDGSQVLLGTIGDRGGSTLWTLANETLADLRFLRVRIEGDDILEGVAFGRGSTIHAIDETTWYAASMSDIEP